MKNYTVIPIPKEETYPWLLKKHYARRIPSSIQYSFGLFDKNLVGVITYGGSGCINNNYLDKFKMVELTRLVINDALPKNTASYFISKTFGMLNRPLALISYADENQNHYGFVYQATNWIYTGIAKEDLHYIDGIPTHRKTEYEKHGTSSISELRMIYGDRYRHEKGKPKHRYFYFVGSKSDKKKMLKELLKKYDILPYPKGEPKRYDSGGRVRTQKRLFL